MVVNHGDNEGLFQGAIMQSGGPIPVGDIDHPNAQDIYDSFVKDAACDNSADTLECLRSIPYPRFKYAMDSSPNFFAYRVRKRPMPPRRSSGIYVTQNVSCRGLH